MGNVFLVVAGQRAPREAGLLSSFIFTGTSCAVVVSAFPGPDSNPDSRRAIMKTLLSALGLVVCICLLAFGRPGTASANMSEDDFRKMEQNWLDAAAGPDLPALRKMFADDFMG